MFSERKYSGSSFFVFRMILQRKDEQNEKEKIPLVRRVDPDCRSAGHHSFYPRGCTTVAARRRFYRMVDMGGRVLPCTVYQGAASQI